MVFKEEVLQPLEPPAYRCDKCSFNYPNPALILYDVLVYTCIFILAIHTKGFMGAEKWFIIGLIEKQLSSNIQT
jgi:hypothetical protein